MTSREQRQAERWASKQIALLREDAERRKKGMTPGLDTQADQNVHEKTGPSSSLRHTSSPNPFNPRDAHRYAKTILPTERQHGRALRAIRTPRQQMEAKA